MEENKLESMMQVACDDICKHVENLTEEELETMCDQCPLLSALSQQGIGE